MVAVRRAQLDHPHGNTRRFWQLSDYKKPDGTATRSARVLAEYGLQEAADPSLDVGLLHGPMAAAR